MENDNDEPNYSAGWYIVGLLACGIAWYCMIRGEVQILLTNWQPEKGSFGEAIRGVAYFACILFATFVAVAFWDAIKNILPVEKPDDRR